MGLVMSKLAELKARGITSVQKQVADLSLVTK